MRKGGMMDLSSSLSILAMRQYGYSQGRGLERSGDSGPTELVSAAAI
jgi:hypothetical protein